MVKGSSEWYKSMANKLSKVNYDLREYTPKGRMYNTFPDIWEQVVWFRETQHRAIEEFYNIEELYNDVVPELKEGSHLPVIYGTAGEGFKPLYDV